MFAIINKSTGEWFSDCEGAFSPSTDNRWEYHTNRAAQKDLSWHGLGDICEVVLLHLK